MIIRSFFNNLIPHLKIFRHSNAFFANDKILDQHEQKKSVAQTSTALNSIRPQPEEGYAYGHYFPK